MVRTFIALFLALASFTVLAKTILADKIPLCEKGPYVFEDMDGDGLPETICLKSKSGKVQNGFIFGAYINFTKSQQSHELFSVLLTSSMAPVYEHDDYLESVDLSKYRHRRLKKVLSGFGLRLVFPEKSSVIVYWDQEKNRIARFQESD